MPIYDIAETKEPETVQAEPVENQDIPPSPPSWKDRLFSALTVRLLFLLLLLGDALWITWSFLKLSLSLPFLILTLGKSKTIRERAYKGWVSLLRSTVCGGALVIALFSPALGIMLACTYFLMYDKAGLRSVIPRSLQDQFQDFLKF